MKCAAVKNAAGCEGSEKRKSSQVLEKRRKGSASILPDLIDMWDECGDCVGLDSSFYRQTLHVMSGGTPYWGRWRA